MGRSVLKNERMKERIHAVFTTNISIAILTPHLVKVGHDDEEDDEDEKDEDDEQPSIEMLVVKTAWILSFILSSLRTERPIVAVKLFNTENRSSVSAAVPV